jgi:integrase
MVAGKRTWVNLETKDYVLACERALKILNETVHFSRESVENCTDRFIAWKLRRGRYTANTAEKARAALNVFRRFVGNRDIHTITVKDCQKFYDHLRETVKASTATSYIFVIRSLFSWMIEVEGRAFENPASKIQMDKVKTIGLRRFCDLDLKSKLIKNATDDDLRFVLYCGFDAGLRKGEIIEARVDWFDLRSGLLHIRKTDSFIPKDGNERAIPLTIPFRNFLAGYLVGKNGYALKPDVRKGDDRYRYNFRRPFADFMQAQGVPWVTPHIMRHSFASILANSGASIFLIAECLGDDVRVVQRHYAKLSPGGSFIHALTP